MMGGDPSQEGRSRRRRRLLARPPSAEPPEAEEAQAAEDEVRPAAALEVPDLSLELLVGEGRALVTVSAPPAPPEYRLPSDVVVLADVSGSMEGDKLERLRATLEWAAEEGFGPGDRAALITFNDQARLELPLSYDRARFGAAARGLRAGGGTDIASAVLLAERVLSSRRAAQPAAIILLSDGQDGRAREACARALGLMGRGAAVRAIGLGEDHDAALLKALADAAHGNFAYAATSECIPLTVGAALASASSLVALRLARLSVRSAERELLLKQELGNLCASESRAFTFTLGEGVAGLQASLDYTKVSGAEARAAAELPSAQPGTEAQRNLVLQHALREAAAAALENATRCMELGQASDAVAPLRAAAERIRASPVCDSDMSRELLAELEAAAASCAEPRAGAMASLVDGAARHTSMRATGMSPVYATPRMTRVAQRASARTVLL
jgi:Mg-chelatase subunit ChlD